jgi:serine/threonine protein kinase/tetratricopeptide (TPR) repeat protein
MTEVFSQNGRYTHVRPLGEGGMGEVYAAFDTARNCEVAIKTIKRFDANSLYRFKQEFRALADIGHTNLCPLYDLTFENEVWFITMPRIDGVDLLTFIRGVQEEVGGETQTAEIEGKDPQAGKMTAADAGAAQPTFFLGSNDETAGSDDPGFSSNSITDTRVEQTNSFGGSSSIEHSVADDDDFDLLASAEVDEFEMDGEAASFQGFENDIPEKMTRPAYDEDVVRDVFGQLVTGLNALHAAGKLHRDIKPSNVLVDRSGLVQILDFGLVRDEEIAPTENPAEDASLEATPARQFFHTEHGRVVGTIAYMSPEQSWGERCSVSSDWYAVGVMLFKVLTGRRPFLGIPSDVIRQLRNDPAPRVLDVVEAAPQDLAELTDLLLNRNASDRPTGEQILESLGKVETNSSDKRSAAEIQSIFIGRDDQVEQLTTAFGQAAKSSQTIVHLHGQSGSGKSALMTHFLDGIDQRECLIVSGRCYEQESVPYKAMDSVMDELTRELLRLTPEHRSRLLPSRIGELTRLFPVLRRLPELKKVVQDRNLDPIKQKQVALQGFRELIRRLAELFVLVISIDDFQWGDADSADMLADLLAGNSGQRLMLALSYRDEHVESSSCLKNWFGALESAEVQHSVCDIAVAALSFSDRTELVKSLLENADDEIAELIAKESGGNPFFITELVWGARNGQDLKSLEVSGQQHALDEVLWTRIQGIQESARRLLEVVAVAGQPIAMDVAFDAAGLPSHDPLGLTQLRVQRLVRSTGSGVKSDLEPYHDRIRESVVERLMPDVLVQHHGGLADRLEIEGNVDPETLAIHFLGSQRNQKAGDYFDLAGDQASDAFAFDRAAELYRKALDYRDLQQQDELDLRKRMGLVLANAGRGDKSAEQYALASELAPENTKWELECRSGYQYCISGRVEKGRSAMAALLKQNGMKLPESTLGSVASLLWHRTRLWQRGIDFEKRSENEINEELRRKIDVSWSASAGISMFEIVSGAALQSLNLRLSLESGEPNRILRALAWEAVQQANVGAQGIDQAHKYIRAAENISQELDTAYSKNMVLFARGITEFMAGKWDSAIEKLDQCVKVFSEECYGVHWEIGTARLFTLYAIFYCGQMSEHRRRSTDQVDDAERRGDWYTQLSLESWNIPFNYLMDDDPKRALDLLAESKSKMQLKRYTLQDMFAMTLMAYTHLYLNDPQQAWQIVRSSWKHLQRSFMLQGEVVRVVSWQARGRAAVGCVANGIDRRRYAKDARKCIRKLESEKAKWPSSWPVFLKAGLVEAEGDRSAAIDLLQQAIRIALETDMLTYLYPARWQLGHMLGGSGGREMVQQADKWMRNQGIQNPAKFSNLHLPGFQPDAVSAGN